MYYSARPVGSVLQCEAGKWLKIASNGWKWLEKQQIAGRCWNLQKRAGNWSTWVEMTERADMAEMAPFILECILATVLDEDSLSLQTALFRAGNIVLIRLVRN